MPMKSTTRIAPAPMLVFALALVCPSAAQAQASEPPSAARCIEAADRGQLLRDDGKLKASRAELVTCGAESCPTLVRRECVRWLEDVDARTPTLVVLARDASGRDVPGARIDIDGAEVDANAAGRPLRLDPGRHVIQARAQGRAQTSEVVVLHERERDRVVTLKFPDESPVAVKPLPPRPEVRRVPVLSWVFGALAVAGGAGFGVFWARGMDRVSELRASCSPFCTPSEIDEARTPLDIARISAAVGVVSAVVAVAVYALTPPKRAAVARTTGER